MRKFLFLFLLLFVFLPACNPTEPVRVVETATQAPQVTVAAAATPTRTTPPTALPTPSETPIPTPTLPPTSVPTPTETPLPLGSQTIGVANAAQLTELAALGKGSILKFDRAAGGDVLLVLTPLGLYHLDPASLAQIMFQAGAQDYEVLEDDARLLVRYPEGQLAVVQAADGMTLHQMSYTGTLPWFIEEYLAELKPDRRAEISEYFRSQLFEIRALATSADLTRLAIATGDEHIRIWSLEDGSLVQDLAHDLVTEVDQMAFSPDAQKLVVVERGRDMGMWNVPQAKLLWHHKGVGHINGQPFSPDGKLLAAEISSYISADAWVLLLNAEYGDQIGKITGARVSSNPFSADGKHLATYWYQRARIFLTTNLAYIQKIETGVDIASLSYSPDGATLLVNGGEQAWNSQDFSPADAAPFKPAPAPVYEDPTTELRAEGFYTGLQGVLPLADGSLRAWGSLGQREFYWFDLPEDELYWMALPEDPANAPLFAADGSAVFYCNTARLFVVPAFGLGARDLGRCSERAVLAYAPATGILARGQGTTLDLIDAATGEIVHNLLGHFKQVSGLTFSESGRLLASGSADVGSRGYGEVAMWTTEPAHNLALDNRQPWGVYKLAYSPDERWLAFYNNGNLRIWSVPERRLYAYFDSSAVEFTFSPDSGLLVAGDRDGNVILYEVPSGKELAVYPAALRAINGLSFSLDSRTLIVTSHDGIVRLFGMQAP